MDTPATPYDFWKQELQASKKAQEGWHRQAAEVLREYLDERDGPTGDAKKWNLFFANVTTEKAMLYGRPPSVSVDRRHADARDDVARVAGECLERNLNLDIDNDGDGLCSALGHALEDALLVDFGCARIRYEVETEEVAATAAIINKATGAELAPAVEARQQVTSEDVEVDYIHWRDFCWSAGARTWGEVRWVAFRAEMTREDCVRHFGEEVGSAIPLDVKRGTTDYDDTDAKADDKRDRACVYEVWDRASREVLWVSESYPAILKRQPDALGLEGFFPCPAPMVSNTTTSRFMPRPSYVLARDLYKAINDKVTRIAMLEGVLRATGIYDATQPAVKRILSESRQNELYPAENWAALAEKGGLRGVVDYFPLGEVAAALGALREGLAEDKQALYEVTGWADIMRGQTDARETARAQGVKAQYGSVRIQARQDRFARFASDIAALKAEVIRTKFEPATIAARSNLGVDPQSPDAQVLPQAVELIKSGNLKLRVEVKPESVSLTDFAALRNEKTEAMAALSQFLAAAAPLMADATTRPYLLQMLQWSFAGLRGASTIEGVLDQAIAASQQAAQQAAANPQQQQPDSKLLAQQMKGQQDMEKARFELEADLTREQAKVQADAQREENQAMWNTREHQAKTRISEASRAARPGLPPGRNGGY